MEKKDDDDDDDGGGGGVCPELCNGATVNCESCESQIKLCSMTGGP
jgi:hypothetical protein